MAKKILVIEDNKAELLAYQNIIKEAGYDVAVAANGVEGWDMVQSEKPDLVLLDILLPKMNGYDVLTHCKTDPATKDIPVIIMTNLVQGDEAEKSFSLGAADHLVKTAINPRDIILKIKKYLK